MCSKRLSALNLGGMLLPHSTTLNHDKGSCRSDIPILFSITAIMKLTTGLLYV